MRRRDLARQNHLDAGEQRVGGFRFAVIGGVFQDQHATLGLLGGDQAAGFHDQGLHVAVTPDMRLASLTGSLVTTEFITFHSGAMSFLAIRS